MGVLAAATAKAAPAAPPSNKAVVLAGGDDRAGKVELKLAGALGRAGVDVVDLEARFPPPLVSSEEGDKLAKEGREAYDNLDTEAAVQKLSAATAFYESNAAATKVEPLAELFVFLGASHLQNGKKDEAKKAFMRAVETWPTTVPDPKLFGSDVQKAFEAAKKDVVGDGTRAKVHVTSVPSGGATTVQGKGAGETPLDAPVEVIPGKVAVYVTRPGFTDWGALVDARPGQQVDVKAELSGFPALLALRKKSAPLATQKAFAAAQQAPEARAIAQDAGGRYLVLAHVADTVTVQVWDTHEGHRMKDVTFAASDEASLTAAAAAIFEWLQRPKEVAQVKKPSGLPGVLKQWWFWAAVGGGVVVAGTVTGIAIGASQPAAPSYSVLLE